MSDNRFKAAVVGCISIDICPQFVIKDARDFADVIQPGAITRILGNDVFPGGSVANTGTAMKIFGVDPILCGKIGKDGFGQILKTMMIEATGEEAMAGIIEDPASDTAYSLILAPQGLDRAILQNPGGNNDYLESEIDLSSDTFKDCKLVHFGHPPNMLHFYEDCGFGLVHLFHKARKRGMLTSLDLCAIDRHSESGQADWETILANVLPQVDFFCPSIDELRDMLNMPGAEPADLAARSRSMGATNIMIKCGEDGIYYENIDDFSDIERRLELEEGAMADWEGAQGMAPVYPIERVVSGLGAGDATVGAYLAGLLRGFSFEDTIKLSLREGALCVTDASSCGGLIPFEEALKL